MKSMIESKKLENALNECVEMLARGQTIGQCLERFPEYRNDLESLLQTVAAVRKAAAVEPSPEFRQRARFQLDNMMRESAEKKRRAFPVWAWQPWATAVAVCIAVLVVGGGTLFAAARSMPDQPLYAVKLAAENVRVALTPSALGKAEVYTELADKRVAEIAYMAEKSNAREIEETSRLLDSQLASIASLAGTPAADTGTAEMARAPASQEFGALQEEPKDTLPEEETVTAAVTEATEEPQSPTVPQPAPAPPQVATVPQTPPAENASPSFKAVAPAPTTVTPTQLSAEAERRARLKATVVRHAYDHQESLRAALKKVPESVRPALLRAILLSEMRYKEVIKSLDSP